MEAPYKMKRPAGVEKFILEQADKTYLVYDRKADTVICTRCGKVHKLSEMNDGEYFVHDRKHYCYDCRTDAICKDNRYGRKKLTEFGRVLWFTKHGPTTFAQLDEYQIDYTGDVPKVRYWPSSQYKLNSKEQVFYKHIPVGYYNDERWEQRKRVCVPEPCGGMFRAYSVPRYQKTILYPVVKTGKDLKHAELRWESPYTMIGYFANFLKYPAIEMLESAEMYYLIEERAHLQGNKLEGETPAEGFKAEYE